MPVSEDAELIDAYRAGDEAAFGALVQRHLKAVYTFALRLSGNPADADDATQETFLKAWKYFPRFREGANFRTWVLSIAHNTTLDILRKRRDVPMSTFDSPEGGNVIEETTADTEPGADDLFAHRENIARLEGYLAQLPVLQREVLTLYFTDHLTFREIGEITNEPLHTVKSRHRRAVESLRSMMATAPKGPVIP